MKKLLIAALFIYSLTPASAQYYPYGQYPYSSPGYFGAPSALQRGIINTPQYQQSTPVYTPGFINTPNYLAPVYSAPVPLSGGYFGIGSHGMQYNFWKSSSGYYYPWGYNPLGYSPAPIIIYQQGAAVESLPPISTEFRDMEKYMDESRASGKLEPGDFEHLNRRLHDLMGKADEERTANGGGLDAGAEADLRGDLNSLGDEMSHRIRH